MSCCTWPLTDSIAPNEGPGNSSEGLKKKAPSLGQIATPQQPKVHSTY